MNKKILKILTIAPTAAVYVSTLLVTASVLMHSDFITFIYLHNLM